MKIEEQIELTNKKNGVVEVHKITTYYKEDGSILTTEHHRDTLAPNELERAEKMLDEYNLNILKAIWTDEIIESYVTMVEENNKLDEPSTEEPSEVVTEDTTVVEEVEPTEEPTEEQRKKIQ